jgi:hypothetical protein
MPAIGQETDPRQERLDDVRDELDHHCAYDDVLREKACIIEVLVVSTLDLVSISLSSSFGRSIHRGAPTKTRFEVRATTFNIVQNTHRLRINFPFRWFRFSLRT